MSSSVRNAKTPSLSSPSIGGIHAVLPVASSSVSYGVTLPSSAGDGLRDRIDVDDRGRRAAGGCRCCWYHSSGLSDDVVGGLLAGEHRRQQDAVVVDVRLVAEHRDVEVAARACRICSTHAMPAMPLPTTTRRFIARVAFPDNSARSVPTRSTRTADCL